MNLSFENAAVGCAMTNEPHARAFPLSMASENATVSVVTVPGGDLARRLCDLGLTVGAEITVRQRQGAGLVVTRGGARFAIGGGMAHRIFVRAAVATRVEELA